MPGTITVASKLPFPLIMRLFDMEEYEQVNPITGETRMSKRAVARGREVRLNGCARHVGKDLPHMIIGGAGLTPNVDADFFAEWCKRNADIEFLNPKAPMVFAHKTDTVGAAKDHKAVASGFEPIDPKNLPAEFKGKIETAQAAA